MERSIMVRARPPCRLSGVLARRWRVAMLKRIWRRVKAALYTIRHGELRRASIPVRQERRARRRIRGRRWVHIAAHESLFDEQ